MSESSKEIHLNKDLGYSTDWYSYLDQGNIPWVFSPLGHLRMPLIKTKQKLINQGLRWKTPIVNLISINVRGHQPSMSALLIPQVKLLTSTVVWKYYMENWRNNQCVIWDCSKIQVAWRTLETRATSVPPEIWPSLFPLYPHCMNYTPACDSVPLSVIRMITWHLCVQVALV